MTQEVKVEVTHFKIHYLKKVKNINGLEYKSEGISSYIARIPDKIGKYSNVNKGLKLK